MAAWSSVNIGQLPNFRFDAEYYQPDYVELSAQLAKVDPQSIGDFAYVTDGIHASPEWVEEGGMRYLSAKSVKDNEIILHTAGQISLEQHRANPRTEARINDVLLTTVGTIGNAAVVDEDVLPANMDRHLGIIRINNLEHVDPYYLATFLNSKYGMFQSVRESTGNVQLNLFIDKIKKIQVPVGEKFNRIGQLTRQSYDLRREASRLHRQAEDDLLAYLGLGNLQLENTSCYTVPFTNTRAADRLDAEYFNPQYLEFERSIEHKNARRLETLCELINYGTVPTSPYTESGIPYIKGMNLVDGFVGGELDLLQNTDDLPRKMFVQEGDVVISQMGTVGKAGLITSKENGYLFASFTIRVRLASFDFINPYVLTLYINAVAREWYLLRKIAQASVRQNTDLPTIKAMPVPKIDASTQQGVADKLISAQRLRAQAQAIISEAKLLVEQLILES